jgi:hypothetical protein
LASTGPTGVTNTQANGFGINADGVVYSCTASPAGLYNGTCIAGDYWNDITALDPWTSTDTCTAVGTKTDGSFVVGGAQVANGSAVNFDTDITTGTWITYTLNGAPIQITDVAYDGNGIAYFVSGKGIYKTATSGSGALTQVATLNACPAALNGVAFDSRGYIYYSCANRVYRAPMNALGQITFVGTLDQNSNDLGSCAYPTAFTG